MGSNPTGKTSTSSRQTQVATKTETVGRIRKSFEPQQVTESHADGLEERIRELAVESLLNSRAFTRRVILDRWFLHSRQPTLEVPHCEADSLPVN